MTLKEIIRGIKASYKADGKCDIIWELINQLDDLSDIELRAQTIDYFTEEIKNQKTPRT